MMAITKRVRSAGFIEPMECLPVTSVPKGADWTYELKLDGYRMQVVKRHGTVALYSRRKNLLNKRFGLIAKSLKDLPDETVLDGELVGVGSDGRPSFHLLQNVRSVSSEIVFYAFDILVIRGEDVMGAPLSRRREILSSTLKPKGQIGLSAVSRDTAAQMLRFVKEHGLEGIVAKQDGGVYEPGRRTGLCSKYRANLGQEFVIGGYVPSHLGVDSIVTGVYRGRDLHYTARVRAGFVPVTRRLVFDRIKHLKTAKCPFVNLPETEAGRWGQGLTAEKMKECVWLKPEAVAYVEFLEWTGADHLRHTKFVAMRDDKEPRKIIRET